MQDKKIAKKIREKIMKLPCRQWDLKKLDKKK